MLHVILQILSIIGIILLCILGLLLLIILLILFVPIRYRVCGKKNTEETWAEAKATYLLHLVSVKFTYREEARLVARIFGFRVYDSAKAKAEEEKVELDKTEAKKTEPDNTEPSNTETNNTEINNAETESAEAKKESLRDEIPRTEQTETDTKPKESFFTKIKNKILGIIEKIKYTITSICDKIKNITETISYYKDVLDDKENRALFKRVWERVLKVLKSIRPRKLKANLTLGTGAPDTTGYVCALYGMLSSILGKHVWFTADFEEKVFEGDFYAKGRITVFTLLVQALKVFFDKQLRIFIKQLKREDI